MTPRIFIHDVYVCVLVAAWLLTSGLTASANAAQSETPAGHYVLQGMREVGSELLLSEDGQFQYMLAYGAYDEFARGTWKVDGKRVILNSEVKDIPPRFTLKSGESKPGKVVTILVNDKNGRGIPGINVILVFDGNKGEVGYTQSYGYQFSLKDDQLPRMIGLGIKMYNLEPQWTKLSSDKQNYFVFEFDPGTLGQAKFRDQVFQWDDNALTTERNGQRMRYVKQ